MAPKKSFFPAAPPPTPPPSSLEDFQRNANRHLAASVQFSLMWIGYFTVISLLLLVVSCYNFLILSATIQQSTNPSLSPTVTSFASGLLSLSTVSDPSEVLAILQILSNDFVCLLLSSCVFVTLVSGAELLSSPSMSSSVPWSLSTILALLSTALWSLSLSDVRRAPYVLSVHETVTGTVGGPASFPLPVLFYFLVTSAVLFMRDSAAKAKLTWKTVIDIRDALDKSKGGGGRD